MTTTTATTTIMDLVNVVSGKTTQLADQVTNQAAAGGRELWFSFLGINWATPTWDLVILLFFVVTIVVYSFVLGRDRIVAILISTYLALAVATNLPYIDIIGEVIRKSGVFAFQTFAFLVVFGLLFFFLSRSQLVQSFSQVGGGWWQVILFSLLQVGLMVSIVLSFLPAGAVAGLSGFTQGVFLSDLGRFCWIVLPIVALVFVRGKSGSGGIY